MVIPQTVRGQTERKHIQTQGRRRIMLLLSSKPLGLHPEAMFSFRLCPDHQLQDHRLNVCDNWIPGCGSYSQHKCMQARLPLLQWHCHTFMRAHTPFFHSCKYTLLTHFWRKQIKPHWITAGQWVKAGHHGNKLRGSGAGCLYVGRRGDWGTGFGCVCVGGWGGNRSSCCIWLVNNGDPKLHSNTPKVVVS